jgi:hypothetical protein
MTMIESQQPATQRGVLDDWLAGLSVETGLLILIGVIAVGLRLLRLGDLPLSASEAREALSAWRLVSMSNYAPVQPVSAAWYTLTALTFWLLGASEFWARFWPMVAGVAIVFTPLVFRRELGRAAAVIACAVLALSPTLLATARTADGTTLAALGLVLSIAGLRRLAANEAGWWLAGLGLGLGMASGPRFVSGLAAGLFALGFVVFIKPQAARSLRAGWLAIRPRLAPTLMLTGLAFVSFASAGVLIPSGLSAAGSALPRWLAGWSPVAARSLWLIPETLFVYEPLLVVMGLAGLYVAFLSDIGNALAGRIQLIFANRDSETDSAAPGAAAAVPWKATASILGSVIIGAILFGVLYVGRETSDAIWVVLPLALLSGKVLAETFGGDWFEGEWETVLAQAGVLFVMLVFAYFHLSGYGRGYLLVPDRPIEIRLYLAGGVLLLGIFVTVMFGLGWSGLSALRGAAVAVGAATLIGTVSAGAQLTQWRMDDPAELWVTTPTTEHLTLLMESVYATSQRSVGKEQEIELAVVGDPAADDANGLLGWAFRYFPKARFVDSVALAVGSPIVIVDSTVDDPALNSKYLGEDFPVQSRQQLTEPTFQTLINWWLYRVWPTEFSRTLTLWVRPDVHNLIQQHN